MKRIGYVVRYGKQGKSRYFRTKRRARQFIDGLKKHGTPYTLSKMQEETALEALFRVFFPEEYVAFALLMFYTLVLVGAVSVLRSIPWRG